MITRKVMLQNTPCRKSVTMTAICPPRNTKKIAVESSSAMRKGNVSTCAPSSGNDSGSPQIQMKNRALTAGKIA